MLGKFFDRSLTVVEKVGNKLPSPSLLFGILALITLAGSYLVSVLDWNAVNPVDNKIIHGVNLLNYEGIHRILKEMVTNMTGFAPLGVVLVSMLGIGIAEKSGLINSGIKLLVVYSPKKILTFVLVFAGILSNMASDVGYVVLIPLAGVIFASVGRNPIVGMAAAFAGVSGGFSANLFLGTIDPLLAGLTEEGARIMDPSYVVNPAANYYFMFVSTFVIGIAGTVVTEKIVAPKLESSADYASEKVEKLNADEKRGMGYAVVSFFVMAAIILIGVLPEGGFLRGKDGSILHSPLIESVVVFILFISAIMGIAYGYGSKTFKNSSDIVKGMDDSMKSLGSYLTLVFFAAQFVAFFKWSNIGVLTAINGANLLKSLDLGLIPLVILFVIFSAVVNLVIGSASAKWAILAPVFVPIFMLMGYSPELSQAVYRVGDSVSNIISPMMSYFALIITFFHKYDPKAGLGTIISTMLPYSIAFFVIWTALLIVWILIGLPLGPGAGLYYQQN